MIQDDYSSNSLPASAVEMLKGEFGLKESGNRQRQEALKERDGNKVDNKSKKDKN